MNVKIEEKDYVDVVKSKWNSEADAFNQWDSLGQDEKDELIEKFNQQIK